MKYQNIKLYDLFASELINNVRNRILSTYAKHISKIFQPYRNYLSTCCLADICLYTLCALFIDHRGSIHSYAEIQMNKVMAAFSKKSNCCKILDMIDSCLYSSLDLKI